MSALEQDHESDGAKGQIFKTTHWSVVLAAGHTSAPGAQEALEKLCRTYRDPICASVRRKGHTPEDAEDLTQAFFTQLLENKSFKLADRERGRFRTFLRSALDNFLINEWRKATADKRGGGQPIISLDTPVEEGHHQAEPVASELTPDKVFDKQWAVALLDQVLACLRAEYEADGKKDLFDNLKPFVWGEKSALSQTEIGARLGMKENAVAQAVHRLRKRYGELLRAEVANTVEAPGNVEDELRHLLQTISG